jgi:hypothetical protein
MFLLSFFIAPSLVIAMTGTDYKINFDSINSGGGLSSSTNYVQENTVGEVATGYASSTNYTMHAGFQQLDNTYLSITSNGPINLPNMNGLTGGTSNGSGAWNVKTNNNTGYSLKIRAATTPALKGLISDFDDYGPSGADPDYTFAIAASTAEFGYTPEGSDIISRFKDNGASCNTGALDTVDSCWDGLSTSDSQIAQANTANHPLGATTTVKFRAQSGSSNIQENDTYTASITITAVTL